MTKQARGYKATLMLGFEDSYGVTATPVGVMMPINTCNLKPSRKKNTGGTLLGTRNPAQPFDGYTDLGGAAVVPVDALSMGYWLKAMFGAPVTTGTGPYVHTFKVGDEQPSLFLETRVPTDVPFYLLNKGCKVSKFSMDVGGDGELLATVDLMGSKQLKGATSCDSTPEAVKFARFSNFQATLKEGGQAIGVCPSFNFSLDAGLDGDAFCIGEGGARGDISEGLMTVSGSLTALLKDAALLDKAMNSTETSLELSFTAGANILTFTFNELQFELTGPTIDGPKGMRCEFAWSAYHADHAASSVVMATLTNTIATY
ncbi:phage tail tube protein [Nitratidesulfovibrio vulgaris]|uniref:Uncharacterized protein n=1 Tax=Nitratidesulfovibrio vulgaris (strain DP4) TaxID=391774 RepID=A0A0H3A6H9_NITV4|nr:phage tail tube protein [Nitratidesulfovibrio vulgaris]ABM28094.1 conserved hypothetical protein [Nitratidesulfovibrio vulgaris DP4]